MSDAAALREVHAEIVGCTRCPRLVWWREEAARTPPRRFRGQRYWARPLPGFGDPSAKILIVGLAPAAHGGNRTGRIFTGDQSGDFLFAALHAVGLANQPTSTHAGDGLRLGGAYIAAVNRCAPPANRPTPAERDNCLPYLIREVAALRSVRVIVGLGAYAWAGVLRVLAGLGYGVRPRPTFAHATEVEIGPYRLVGSFHPSQQNTFTGKLTSDMLQAVLQRAVAIADGYS
jgi:uracil-DNA glycosylase